MFCTSTSFVYIESSFEFFVAIVRFILVSEKKYYKHTVYCWCQKIAFLMYVPSQGSCHFPAFVKTDNHRYDLSFVLSIFNICSKIGVFGRERCNKIELWSNNMKILWKKIVVLQKVSGIIKEKQTI